MLTRWNELGLGGLDDEMFALHDLRNQMDRLLHDLDRGWGLRRRTAGDRRPMAATSWPRIALHDDGAELRLWAEVPGLSEKDLDITVEESSLTLRGERRIEAPEGYGVHRQERGNRKFARSFTLPCRIDAEKARAELKDGVLMMRLPKAPEAQPRQIRVRVS